MLGVLLRQGKDEVPLLLGERLNTEPRPGEQGKVGKRAPLGLVLQMDFLELV